MIKVEWAGSMSWEGNFEGWSLLVYPNEYKGGGYRWRVTQRYPPEGSTRQSSDLQAGGRQDTAEKARDAAEKAIVLFKEFPP